MFRFLLLICAILLGHPAVARRVVPQPPQSHLLLPPQGAQSLAAGSGFFIAPDGSLLTAAHVVQGCQRIDVASDTDATRTAMMVFADNVADLAVLRVPGMGRARLPLAVAAPDPALTGLRVMGYAANAPVRPKMAWANMMNMLVQPGKPANPRFILWLKSPHVSYGWSGGPVLDPSGAVNGVVVSFDPDPIEVSNVLERPETDMVMASGIGVVRSVLRRAGVRPYFPPTAMDADLQGKQAVVRVLCWRPTPPQEDSPPLPVPQGPTAPR